MALRAEHLSFRWILASLNHGQGDDRVSRVFWICNNERGGLLNECRLHAGGNGED